MNINQGDKVKILTGKDNGKEGVVAKVLRADDKAIVDGLNMYKRHKKGRGEAGQIVEFAAPIHISNLKVLESDTKKKTTKKK